MKIERHVYLRCVNCKRRKLRAAYQSDLKFRIGVSPTCRDCLIRFLDPVYRRNKRKYYARKYSLTKDHHEYMRLFEKRVRCELRDSYIKRILISGTQLKRDQVSDLVPSKRETICIYREVKRNEKRNRAS